MRVYEGLGLRVCRVYVRWVEAPHWPLSRRLRNYSLEGLGLLRVEDLGFRV